MDYCLDTDGRKLLDAKYLSIDVSNKVRILEYKSPPPTKGKRRFKACRYCGERKYHGHSEECKVYQWVPSIPNGVYLDDEVKRVARPYKKALLRIPLGWEYPTYVKSVLNPYYETAYVLMDNECRDNIKNKHNVESLRD